MKLYSHIPKSEAVKIDYQENIVLRANTDEVIDLYVIDYDGTPYTIDGATVFFTVKSTFTQADASAVLKKTVTDLTEASNGNTLISIADTDTTNLAGNYLYNITIKLSSGIYYTLKEGIVTFKRSLSSRTS